MTEKLLQAQSSGNVEPLLPIGEHPLVVRRIELSQRLGAIMLDEDRYNSEEWYTVVDQIHEVMRQIREQGIDTSRYHSSLSFPGNNAGAIAALRRRGAQSSKRGGHSAAEAA